MDIYPGTMQLYAVAMMGEDDCIVEFFWADDRDHAREQAFNSDATRESVAIGLVPDEYLRYREV